MQQTLRNFLGDLSIKTKFLLISIFFSSTIIGLAVVSYIAQDANSTVTSYIEGEGYWSKSQRDAVFHLYKYAHTQDPYELQRYREYAQVPLGDKIARLELLKDNPDYTISDQGFIQGRNNPSEVRAMSIFFVRFQNISYMDRAIKLWTQGDENMEKLEDIATRLQARLAEKKQLTLAESAKFMAEIDDVNNTVRLLEDKFSKSLGEAARWLKNLLLWLVFCAALTFVALGLWVAFVISSQILKAIRLIEVGTQEIQTGDLSRKIVVISNDELGQLAQSFNQMTKRLDERTQELEVQRSNSTYSAKMVALGEMAGGIAHEINTPLSAISLTAGLLHEYIENNAFDREAFLKLTSRIESIVKRISNIILGLRKFSRDGSKDDFAPVPLSEILEDSLSFCRERFRENDVDLRIAADYKDLVINCRPVEISQVLVNLMNNSFDAIADMDNKWVEISAKTVNKQVVISVTDSGNGISAEVQNKIFQPFFTTKDVGSGTGLGLSISAGIISTHGGELEYDKTSPNTSFKIILPLAEPTKV